MIPGYDAARVRGPARVIQHLFEIIQCKFLGANCAAEITLECWTFRLGISNALYSFGAFSFVPKSLPIVLPYVIGQTFHFRLV